MVVLLGLSLVWSLNANGQRRLRERVVLWADWECLTTNYPKTKLNRVVRKAVSEFGKPYGTTWGDRALSYDLNGDGNAEYFIPLGCSPVGNCSWGVFGLNPARLIGVIGAENIYVRKRTGGWSALIAYGHVTASDGVITYYAFRNGKYKKLPGDRNVSTHPNLDSFLPGRIYPQPKFLSRILSPCASGRSFRASP